MSKRDYYDVLGVSRTASDAELKKAYRRLAMKYHPDRNDDDPLADGKFKEVKEAYDVLSNGDKRAAYDQFGHAAVNNTGASGNWSGDVGDIFESVFGDIFGGRGNARHANRGSDLQYDITLNLEDAINGTSMEINIPKLSACHSCRGTGAKSGSQPVSCSTCKGQGQIRMQQGFFSLQQTCPQCRGSGQIIKDHCPQCRGQGRVKESKTIVVEIPAGIDHGNRIRLQNEGEAGANGAPPGDLYIAVSIKKHKIFKRDNNDLYCDVPLSYATAALGREIDIPTLNGKIKLSIPAGTQSDQLFRLRGKGVRSARSSAKGDLFCRTVIETPVKLTKKQKELLKEFESTMAKPDGDKHHPQSSSWLQGVKNFFDDMRN